MKQIGKVVLLGLLLGGCSGPGPAKTNTTSGVQVIKVAYWGGPEEMAILQDITSRWQSEHPEVEVRLEHTPFSGYLSRLLTRIAGDVAPDVMAVEVNLFPPLWSKGAFLSLQPFIEKDPTFKINDFFPDVMKRFTVDGELFAIPRDTAPFACVFYNKKLFDSAGLPYPTDDWTWDDMLKAAKALTKRDETGRVTQYGLYAWAWQNFVYSNGGQLVDDLRHPTRLMLNEPAAVEALQFYADLMNKEEVAPSPMALGNLAMGSQQLFMTQRVAMFSSGVWEVPTLRQITDFDWDVVMFPKGPKGKRAFATGGTGYSILKTTKHPELAWEVLKALTGEEAQRRMAETGLVQPANRVVAEGPAFAQNPLPPAHKAMLNDAVQYVAYEPFMPEWREISELYILPELDLIFHGEHTAQQAVDAFASKVNSLLSEQQKKD